MKRLFLASSGLTYIKEFVGTEPAETRMLFIPTAGNLDTEVWWIDKDRDVLAKMGFKVTELDIEKASKPEMEQALADTDIVYVAGGNTFHLLKVMRESGFDEMLTNYVDGGGLYAGASAGSLIAGADIGSIASLDEPERVKGLKSTKGLGFVDIVPVPHCDPNDNSRTIDDIKSKYGTLYELVLLNDDQAILAEGEKWSIVDSPRSPLELEWFKRSGL